MFGAEQEKPLEPRPRSLLAAHPYRFPLMVVMVAHLLPAGQRTVSLAPEKQVTSRTSNGRPTTTAPTNEKGAINNAKRKTPLMLSSDLRAKTNAQNRSLKRRHKPDGHAPEKTCPSGLRLLVTIRPNDTFQGKSPRCVMPLPVAGFACRVRATLR